MRIPAPILEGTDFLSTHRISFLAVLAAVSFIAVAWITVSYFIYPGYIDHGEPSVALISWRLLDGFPAYPGFDEPGMVGNVYGPIIFVFHSLVFWIFGPALMIGKVGSLFAAALIPVLVFLSHRKSGMEYAFLGAIAASGLVLLNVPSSLWNRPDSLIALLVVIAVWAARAADPDRPEWIKSGIIAVAAALATGMELHGGIYFAPIVLFHCFNENRGFKAFIMMSVVGLAVVMLPFAFSVFSLPAFKTWIVFLLGKESPAENFLEVAQYGLVYLTAALFFLAHHRWSKPKIALNEKVYFWVFIGSLAVLIFPASKAGAGAYYYFPFLGIFIDQVFRHSQRVTKHRTAVFTGFVGIVVLVLVLSIPVQKRFYRSLHWDKTASIQSEIRTIMGRYKDQTIEMGVGQDVTVYPITFYRTLLVLKGHPYTIDPAPGQKMTMLGIPLPDDLLALIRGCNTEIWLIPKDENPFTMIGYYGTPVVTQAFTDTFLASYVKKESYGHFDVWGCKR